MIRPVVKVEQVSGVPAHSVLYSKMKNGEVIPLDFTRHLGAGDERRRIYQILPISPFPAMKWAETERPTCLTPSGNFSRTGVQPFLPATADGRQQPPVEMGAGPE